MTFGNQHPRVMSVPDYVSSAGVEAIQLAEYAGLVLDPWQQIVLMEGLGELDSGAWSAFEVSVVVSRQNGKGAIIEARELAGLFLFGEQLIVHTAHEFKTSAEAFDRIRALIDNTDDLRKKVRKVITSHGSECIELMSGQRLRFLSRTKGSGRGFSCDCVIMDESMILGSQSMAALLPTLSARENPQVWYFGSAGMGEVSTQLAMLRHRGLSNEDKSLAYFEWSVDVHNEQCMPSCTLHRSTEDRDGWLEANPGIGYRITTEYIEKERRSLGPAMFGRERLGVGDYPDLDLSDSPISLDEWTALANEDSAIGKDVAFAVDIPPNRTSAVIAVYSESKDGVGHMELIDRRFGTDWVVDRLTELKDRWKPVAIALDAKGPAASLLADLEHAGIKEPKDSNRPKRGNLFLVSGTDMQQACGQLVDAVRQMDFEHLGDEVLTMAISGACAREVGDAWVWARRKSTVDIAPLVAATMARHAYIIRYPQVAKYNALASAW